MRRIISSAAAFLLFTPRPTAAQIVSDPVVLPAGAASAPFPLPSLSVPLAPVLAPWSILATAPTLTAAPAAAAAPMAAAAPVALAASALAPALNAPAAVLPRTASASAAKDPTGASTELDALTSNDPGLEAAFDGRASAEGLDRLAFDVTPKSFPGGSGAAITLGRNMRAIVTKQITAADLPYRTTLRAPQPVSLPASLETAPRAAVKTVTDVAFASEEHSGSAGLVRLGYLDDGRPVALKAYHLRDGNARLEKITLEETRSAKLLSDLGVGPLFHGVWRDQDGHWNVVFDIARGDFSGTPVTMNTFHDLENILSRLKKAGIRSFGDLQMYRDADGRLSIIDPGTAASGRTPLAEPDEPGGYATKVRLEQIHAAGVSEGRRYLEWLHARHPDAFESLRTLLRRSPARYAQAIEERFPEYFPLR